MKTPIYTLLLCFLATAAHAGDRPTVYIRCSSDGDSAATRQKEICRQLILGVRSLQRYSVLTSADLQTVASLNDQAPPPADCCQSVDDKTVALLNQNQHLEFFLTATIEPKEEQHRVALQMFTTDPSELCAEVQGVVPSKEGTSNEGTAQQLRRLAQQLHRKTIDHGTARKAYTAARSQEQLLQPRQLEWTWLVGGLSVISAVTAGLMSLEAVFQQEKFDDLLEQAQDEQVSATLVRDVAERTERQALYSNVMWGMAGGLALTTAVVLTLELPLTPSEPAVTDSE